MKRGNGRGSIYFEKARKKWIAAITEPETGKRVVKRFAVKQDAEAYLDKVNTQVHEGTYTPKNNMTIGEWLLLYVQTYKKGRVKPSTYSHYLCLLTVYEPISNIVMQDETGLNVQRFFNGLKLSASYKRVAYRFLRSSIRKAVALNFTPKNFMDSVEIEREPQLKREIFTLDELSKIDKAAEGYTIEPIYLVAKYTGMRLGEILALTWDDINLSAGTITVNKDIYNHIVQMNPKTSSSNRTISIGSELVNYLSSYKEKHNHPGIIFVSNRGKPRAGADIRPQWVRCLERAGVRYRPFHCLRHTHASLLLANNVPVVDVSHRLGHSTPAITYGVYAHYIKKQEATGDDIESIYCYHVATKSNISVATKVSSNRKN